MAAISLTLRSNQFPFAWLGPTSMFLSIDKTLLDERLKSELAMSLHFDVLTRSVVSLCADFFPRIKFDQGRGGQQCVNQASQRFVSFTLTSSTSLNFWEVSWSKKAPPIFARHEIDQCLGSGVFYTKNTIGIYQSAARILKMFLLTGSLYNKIVDWTLSKTACTFGCILRAVPVINIVKTKLFRFVLEFKFGLNDFKVTIRNYVFGAHMFGKKLGDVSHHAAVFGSERNERKISRRFRRANFRLRPLKNVHLSAKFRLIFSGQI